MTNDSAFISEIWAAVKENIDQSYHLEVCDKLVELFDSYNMAGGFSTDIDFEQPLMIAITSYYGIEEEEGETHDD